MASEKKLKINQSLVKALQIIEVMAENKGAMRLQDIAEKLSLPTSTTLRFLNTMLTQDYVQQDPETLKYRLSFKFCKLGHMIESQINLRDIVRPYLIQLSHTCNESTCLAIEEQMEVVYIDVVDGPDNILKITQRVGKRAPLHSTGVGKLLLLNYSPQTLDDLIAKKGLVTFTDHTIAKKQHLIDHLEQIRSDGYAMDDEECEIGVRCVAAPIFDHNQKIIAALSISGPTSRIFGEKLELIKEKAIETAACISKYLGKE